MWSWRITLCPCPRSTRKSLCSAASSDAESVAVNEQQGMRPGRLIGHDRTSCRKKSSGWRKTDCSDWRRELYSGAFHSKAVSVSRVSFSSSGSCGHADEQKTLSCSQELPDKLTAVSAIYERQEHMGTIARNAIAVTLGVLVGSLVNMGLIMVSGQVIPPPEGVDVTNMESLRSSMHLFAVISRRLKCQKRNSRQRA